MKLTYKVLPGKVITGQHEIYREGRTFTDAEACGDMAQAVKDGTVMIVQPAAVEPEKPTEDDEADGLSSFDELMAKTDAELAEIAKEYNVEDAAQQPDKEGLVKAIMLKAGYSETAAVPSGRPGRGGTRKKNGGAK